MARQEIDGLGIEYELLGPQGAPAVAITPGGRFSKDVPGIREMGQALADRGHRVLLWDRPNCGASDMRFDPNGELRMQASVPLGLISALELGPTALAAGSAGARVSLLAAAAAPEAISHLSLWWISGGIASSMMLGASYCCEPAVVAAAKGMEAVAAMPAFADHIQRNPRSRDVIVNQDPAEFIATMERWAAGFIPSPTSPVPGMERAGLRAADDADPACRRQPHRSVPPGRHGRVGRAADPPCRSRTRHPGNKIFDERIDDAAAEGTGLFIDWPDLAPTIADFIGRRQ